MMKKTPILMIICLLLIAGLSCKKKDQAPSSSEEQQVNLSQKQLEALGYVANPEDQVQAEKITPPQPAPIEPAAAQPPVALAAYSPILQAAIQIKDGDQPLSIGHTTSPEVVDWNNDGKKDLLVGTFSQGKIKLFLNQGTDAEPVFNGGEWLTAGGEELHAGSG